jgi:hypothetical protein
MTIATITQGTGVHKCVYVSMCVCVCVFVFVHVCACVLRRLSSLVPLLSSHPVGQEVVACLLHPRRLDLLRFHSQ